MAVEWKKMLFSSWKKAAKFSATWAVCVGAFSLIMNAVPSLVVPLLLILVPVTLAVPALIGFFVTKHYLSNQKIDAKIAAAHGAVCGVVYAAVMIAVSLFFIAVNYAAAAFVGGDFEIFAEGLIVLAATLIIGFPVMAIFSAISGGIGGWVYSSIRK